ncbi:hypothetical protein SAMN05216573_10198 [Bradyrhizobium sp. Rc3b]|nr:hypothetical protein SAMN05216573_10198 [Bradyrhizobium sp. Rc3b]
MPTLYGGGNQYHTEIAMEFWNPVSIVALKSTSKPVCVMAPVARPLEGLGSLGERVVQRQAYGGLADTTEPLEALRADATDRG